MRQTLGLRVLLSLLALGLLLAAGLLYLLSLDSAAMYPEVAHLRAPIYGAVLIGLLPMLVAMWTMFGLLRLVDDGEAFSARTVRLLRRIKIQFGVTAAYLVLGLLGVWVALSVSIGHGHPSIILGWLAAEVVALFLFTLASLLERLFADALRLREDNELTV